MDYVVIANPDFGVAELMAQTISGLHQNLQPIAVKSSPQFIETLRAHRPIMAFVAKSTLLESCAKHWKNMCGSQRRPLFATVLASPAKATEINLSNCTQCLSYDQLADEQWFRRFVLDRYQQIISMQESTPEQFSAAAAKSPVMTKSLLRPKKSAKVIKPEKPAVTLQQLPVVLPTTRNATNPEVLLLQPDGLIAQRWKYALQQQGIAATIYSPKDGTEVSELIVEPTIRIVLCDVSHNDTHRILAQRAQHRIDCATVFVSANPVKFSELNNGIPGADYLLARESTLDKLTALVKTILAEKQQSSQV